VLVILTAREFELPIFPFANQPDAVETRGTQQKQTCIYVYIYIHIYIYTYISATVPRAQERVMGLLSDAVLLD
jgi:hypothetical protein